MVRRSSAWNVYGAGKLCRHLLCLLGWPFAPNLGIRMPETRARDLDVAILQHGKPRRLTQLSSLEVYKAGLNGIYYRSRYGHDLRTGLCLDHSKFEKSGTQRLFIWMRALAVDLDSLRRAIDEGYDLTVRNAS
jgi:hypothetical protein